MAVALIVAAGSGRRLGADRPKALVPLAGRPLLQWSIDVLAKVVGIEQLRAGSREVCATLDRRTLWAVQTPQAFRRAALERALDVEGELLAQATDDAWLVERAGGKVVVVSASEDNLKITTARDLQLAELLLSGRAQQSA